MVGWMDGVLKCLDRAILGQREKEDYLSIIKSVLTFIPNIWDVKPPEFPKSKPVIGCGRSTNRASLSSFLRMWSICIDDRPLIMARMIIEFM